MNLRPVRTVLILTAVTLAMLLVCEVSARALRWAPSASPNTAAFGYARGGAGDLAPNQHTIVTLLPDRPYLLITNSVGLRSTEDLDPDAFRILAIGDSFTFGAYVHNGETWTARLQEHLAQRGTGQRVQVLNAGIPGYTLQDELAYLRDKGLALNPDLILLGVYTNDIFDYDGRIRPVLGREAVLASDERRSGLTDWLAANSALYSVAVSLRGEPQDAVQPFAVQFGDMQAVYQSITFTNPDGHAEYWDGYRQDFQRLVDLLNEAGIPWAVVLFPDLAQFPTQGGLPTAPQAFMADLTAAAGVPYLDLLPVFRAEGDIQSLYLMYFNPDAQVSPDAPDAAVQIYTGDGHPSPYGHLVTARALAEFLAARDLLP